MIANGNNCICIILVPTPKNIQFGSSPISEEDLALINYYSDRTTLAVQKGYSFHTKESFVVKFDP